jgi:hypothetical protein
VVSNYFFQKVIIFLQKEGRDFGIAVFSFENKMVLFLKIKI